jgi:hypothetical protein
MPIKKPLEQPILNAIIRYAYALHEDEEAALLSAFLVISYHIHREAVESMLPDKNYEQFISDHIQVVEPPESCPGIVSPEAVAAPVYHEAMVTGHVQTVVSRVMQSARSRFRRRESVLQEEEEFALFSTIEGVADQVRREAIENDIKQGIGREVRFAAAYERAGAGPWGAIGVPVEEVIAAQESKNDGAKQNNWPMDTYIEFMDEELMITRGIIDRNRALSQGYLNAHAM